MEKRRQAGGVLVEGGFDPKSIERPASELLTYYLLVSILTLPMVILVLPALWFRYITLRYQLDEEGISMRWGVLFHREVVLTYRRIQDIHVTRDLLQRWLGLATVTIQTASGSATPEMKIEGVLEAEALRDFLYQKMRGAKDGNALGDVGETGAGGEAEGGTETLQLLTEIRDHLAVAVSKRGGA